MPPIVGAAAITAGAGLGAAALSYKGNSKASKAQTKATDAALAVEKDNEARRRMEYDQNVAAQKAQWDAEQQRLEPYRQARQLLLRQQSDRLGIPLGDQMPTTRPFGSGVAPVVSPGTGVASGKDRVLSQLASPMISAGVQAPQLTIADLANWGRGGL